MAAGASLVSTLVAALAGMGSAMLTSAVGFVLVRSRVRSETRLNNALAAEIERRLTSTEARVDSLSDDGTWTTFDSRVHGFAGLYRVEPTGGAEGEVCMASRQALSDTLVVRRTNQEGSLFLWLVRYGYPGGPEAIPAPPDGASHAVRFRCEIRALETPCTVVVVLKELDSPHGHHLGHRRMRVAPDGWVAFDESFRVAHTEPAMFRVEVRSPLRVPCPLEIRRVRVADRPVSSVELVPPL